MVPPEKTALRSVRFGNITWTLRADLDAAPLAELLGNPEGGFTRPDLFFKDTRTVTLTRLNVPGFAFPRLVLRRLNYGQFRHRLRDFFRPSRAQRALRMSARMLAAGLPTPNVIAAAEVRRWRWPIRAYLLSEEIPARNLAQRVKAEGKVSPRAVANIASALARLHDQGFSHRDLKWSNVLLDADERAYLIDVDGVRFLGAVGRVTAIKDIRRLALHFVPWPVMLKWTGLRFAVHYCRARRERPDPRAFAREIAAELG